MAVGSRGGKKQHDSRMTFRWEGGDQEAMEALFLIRKKTGTKLELHAHRECPWR